MDGKRRHVGRRRGGGAFELYHFLEEHIIYGGAEVSVFVYNHIIEASVREGSLHYALRTFDKMKEQGVMPDLQTYEWAIAACS